MGKTYRNQRTDFDDLYDDRPRAGTTKWKKNKTKEDLDLRATRRKAKEIDIDGE